MKTTDYVGIGTAIWAGKQCKCSDVYLPFFVNKILWTERLQIVKMQINGWLLLYAFFWVGYIF